MASKSKSKGKVNGSRNHGEGSRPLITLGGHEFEPSSDLIEALADMVLASMNAQMAKPTNAEKTIDHESTNHGEHEEGTISGGRGEGAA